MSTKVSEGFLEKLRENWGCPARLLEVIEDELVDLDVWMGED
jgi:hypothetical protein